jgi:transposase
MAKKKEPTDLTPVTGEKKQIPIEELIEYRRKGLSTTDIAKIVGCSQQNVAARLSKVDLDGLQLFSKHKADVFEAKQRELIQTLTPAKLEAMSASQAFVGIGILEDKVRTIRGQATEIVDHRVITASLAEITERMRTQGLITNTGEISDIVDV